MTKQEKDRTARLVSLGKALSDPIRVQMLEMMARGRTKCEELSRLDIPFGDCGEGICVCEFMSVFNMKQSKVSYHIGKLKAAGLIFEERRGKWIFYSLIPRAMNHQLLDLKHHLGFEEKPSVQEVK